MVSRETGSVCCRIAPRDDSGNVLRTLSLLLLVITSLHRKLGQNSSPKATLRASSLGDLWARMGEQVRRKKKRVGERDLLVLFLLIFGLRAPTLRAKCKEQRKGELENLFAGN